MTDIMDDLPPGTTKYQYTGEQQLLHHINNQLAEYESNKDRSEYLACTHINQEAINRVFLSDDAEYAHIFNSYSPESETLILQMITEAHEQAYAAFTHIFESKFSSMGVTLELRRTAQSTVQTRTRAKNPDWGFRPRFLPAGRSNQWPTLVIEAAYSESKSKLQSDIKWWLSESKGDVKVGLIVLIHKTKRRITVEMWGFGDRATRVMPERKVPYLKQQAVIAKDADEATASVLNSPLIIPFNHVFLRPAKKPKEDDIVITEYDLKQFAETIWETQAF